jgi:hypothetical protein
VQPFYLLNQVSVPNTYSLSFPATPVLASHFIGNMVVLFPPTCRDVPLDGKEPKDQEL